MNQGIAIPYILNEWRKNRTFVQTVSPFDPAYRGWMAGLTESYKACMVKSKMGGPVNGLYNDATYRDSDTLCRCQVCVDWYERENIRTLINPSVHADGRCS